jgi:hypothetical protein
MGAMLAVAVASGPSGAQSLALTYRLESTAEPAQHVPSTLSRCAGFGWLTSFESCGRDLIARILPGRSDARPQPEQTDELPDLGAPVPQPYLKSAGGRDAMAGNGRTPDLMLRLGSKYRFKSSEDRTWESYRFTDANYESHIKNNSHKAVGVELLVPFH